MKEIIFEWRTNKKNQRPISKNWFYIYAKVIPTLIRFKIDSHGVNGVQRKRQTSQSTESFTFNHGMWAFKGFEAISNTHLTNIHNPRYRTSITMIAIKPDIPGPNGSSPNRPTWRTSCRSSRYLESHPHSAIFVTTNQHNSNP